MTNLKKQAAKDAAEFARAQMFYGEGAGTRRKLINSAVDYKVRNVPGYEAIFNKALASQDMAKHAAKATSERSRKDISKKVNRNLGAAVRGNHRNLTTGLAVAVIVGSWMHETGNDKKAMDFTRAQARKVRDKVEVIRFRKKVDKVHNITDVKA